MCLSISLNFQSFLFVARCLISKSDLNCLQVTHLCSKILFLVHNCFNNFFNDNIQQVRHGKLSEADSRKYFQQLIDGVDYCHSKRVYHRDLKVVDGFIWRSMF